MLGHAARRPWSAQQGLHEVEMARAWTARSPAKRSVSLHEREIADSSQLTAQSRARNHARSIHVHVSAACV